jgi:hypothetical protein
MWCGNMSGNENVTAIIKIGLEGGGDTVATDPIDTVCEVPNSAHFGCR